MKTKIHNSNSIILREETKEDFSINILLILFILLFKIRPK